MKNSVDTHMGSIVVDNNVIANYAGNVALECYGVVGMAAVNMRDGFVGLLKKDSMSKGILVSCENNKLKINLHIIVAFGCNIVPVANNLMSEWTDLNYTKLNLIVLLLMTVLYMSISFLH